MNAYPHRRYNPLIEEWVLVSPHRTERPWQGQTESEAVQTQLSYEPECYLCPGNLRANGERNPNYPGVFVFQNDFQALLTESSIKPIKEDLFRSEPVRGECRVICYSPRHDLTMATMSVPEIREVVDLWQSQASELMQRWEWVQIFENRGAAMGCSNPHPHGQIWASDSVPTLLMKEDNTQRNYYSQKGRAMLLEVGEKELEAGERIVEVNEHWVAWVPFWAVWPFEILLAPRVAIPDFEALKDEAKEALASILQRILRRYDALFQTSFPYSFGWHFAPRSVSSRDAWTLHAHFYPPLLRSATVRKFMVGYEQLSEPQRDLTPEQAAARLREVVL